MPKARKPSSDSDAKQPKRTGKGDAAFDVWLTRGLHKIYDDVAQEPIPDDLLRLIEEDRNR